MSKLSVQIAAIILVAATAVAFAANKGGGHPGGGSHGGGGPHGGGGGHPHFGGGGGHPHFGGGGGHPHFGAGGHPSFHARSYSRPVFRGRTSHTVTNHNAPNAIHNVQTGHNNVIQHGRNHAVNNAAITRNSHLVNNALNSRQVRTALHNPSSLRNPNTRSQITARMAQAGWHGGHNGWWRHRHGGYGWVGPLFWPFAYYDFYDYALWGYDDSFWDYGYGDIYAGLFAPYGYDDLAGYIPQPGGPSAGTPSSALAQMCGEDTRDVAGIPVDQLQQALQPNDQQRAALNNLADASAKAAQIIQAACPTDIALTAPGRVDAMQQRVAAVDQAVHLVQPALDKFYASLSDEQKARLNALGEDERRNSEATGSITQDCGASQPGVTDWPTAEIERVVHPTQAQQASLDALKDAADQAAQKLAAACPSPAPITPPDRLAAVGQRLDIMLQSIKSIRNALNNFYASLNDEQKAQFDAIGPQRAVARG